LEKSPPNLIMTRFLTALFPDARIVIVARHPVAVALATEKWVDEETPLGDLLRHWVRAHQIFVDDVRRAHKVRLHVPKYEHLMADPTTELAALQRFWGSRLRYPVAVSTKAGAAAIRIVGRSSNGAGRRRGGGRYAGTGGRTPHRSPTSGMTLTT